MFELINMTAAAWSTFWIGVGGGTMSMLNVMLLSSILIGVTLLFIPLIWSARVMADYNISAATRSQRPPMWKIVVSFATVPWMVVMLAMTLGVGLGAGDHMESHFVECVQAESKLENADTVVWVMSCRDRENIADEFGEWQIRNTNSRQYLTTKVVDELP